MITILLITVFIISVASTWWFGLWSNLITLVNLLLSAMVASSFFVNMTYEIQMRMESFLLLLPFISLWLLFLLTFIVLRGLTDSLSNMRLKFDKATELVGRSLLSLVVAWVLVCFVNFSLHLAPLKETLFSGKESNAMTFDLKNPKAFESVAFGPDLAWARFVSSRSDGSLSYPIEETMLFPKLEPLSDDAAKSPNRVFPATMMLNSGVGIRTAVANLTTLRVPEEFLKLRRETLEALGRQRESEKTSTTDKDETTDPSDDT